MSPRRSRAASAGNPSVARFLDDLEHPHKEGVALLRGLILALDGRITEEIKWNAPSFKLEDHFATFRLHPPKGIQLVLHTGAKVKGEARAFEVDDPEGLLKWPAVDRCVLTLASTAEAVAHQGAVMRIVRQWVAQL